MMDHPRPTYWEIFSAYLRAGLLAYQQRAPASGVQVEQALGLVGLEGMKWMQHLEAQGLIETATQGVNSMGYYELQPPGLAMAERLPAIEAFLANQAAQIERLPSAAPAEKSALKQAVTETILKRVLEKGFDWLVENWSALYRSLRAMYPALPELPR